MFSVIGGGTVLDEEPSLRIAVGGAIVIAGVALILTASTPAAVGRAAARNAKGVNGAGR